jgi:hypothetical protein
MAISGSLEDVSVADVMQFIHLGRRTGVLELVREGKAARVGFHTGKLVSAHGPRSARLGDLLIQAGLLRPEVVIEAIAIQKSESADEARSLGQILLAMEAISPENLKRVISTQIESTISDLVHWDRGTFEFIVDDLRRPVDDIALYPGDLLPDADINTQMVLLEAARIFDERNRDIAALSLGEDTNPTLVLSGFGPIVSEDDAPVAEPSLWPAEPAGEVEIGVHRLQLVTADASLGERLSTALPPGFAPVEEVPIRGAGRPHPGHETPIVILDLRNGAASVEDLARLRRIRRGTPLIALVPPTVSSGSIYQAGALAALPVEIEAIVACLTNLVRNRRRSAPQSGPALPQGTESVARLRRVFGDLRSGLISATVALNLMHIISESVERAVLFLVRRDHLTALGAFGSGVGGRSLAELTRGLHLPLDERHALTDCIQTGEVSAVAFSEIELPLSFSRLVGEPTNGQAVIFPVLGTQRVIAVIYTDNGENEQPIEDIEILELATAQVGMAFENELLRRQILQQG